MASVIHHLLDEFEQLQAYMTRMYERPHAPPRIAKALASIGPRAGDA
jgi:hypothetical protein